MEDNSAAAMIRRFREGKPMSREEREKNRQTSGVDKLWYENESERPRRSLSVEPSAPPVRPSSALRSVRQPTDYMTESTSSLFKGSKLGDTFGVDDLIEKEIRQLEQQMSEVDRRTAARLDLGSFNPTRSYDMRGSLGSMRDSTDGFRLTGRNLRASVSPMRLSGDLLRSSIETLGSTGFRGLLAPRLKLDGKKEEEPKEEKPQEDIAELNKRLEEFLASMKEQNPPRNAYFPEGVDETIAQVTNKVQNDLLDFQHLFGEKHAQEDEVAKAQKERDEAMREEGRRQAREKQLLELDLPATHPLEYFGVWDGQQQYAAFPTAAPYLQPAPVRQGGGYRTTVPSSGSIVTAQAPFAPTAAPEQKGAAGGSVTDYGVRLESDIGALRVSDDSSVGMGSPFPQYKTAVLSPEASVSASAGGLPTIKEEAAQDGPAGGSATPPATAPCPAPTLLGAGVLPAQPTRRVHPSQMVAAQAGLPPGYQGQGLSSSVGLVQAAVDVEMSAATETVAKMRALRTGLGLRTRQLEALYDSVMPVGGASGAGAGTGMGPGAPRVLPLYARPAGPPPAPVYSQLTPPPQYVLPPGYALPPHPQHQQGYWGLEEYYHAQEQARLASIARPPDLQHMDVYGVAKGIGALLDSTISHLNTQLPPAPLPKFTPRAASPYPTLAQATAEAATKLILTPRPEVTPTPRTETKSPAPTSTTPTVPTAPTPVDAHKAAVAVVNEVLNLKDYEKKSDGSITHTPQRVPPIPLGAATAAAAGPHVTFAADTAGAVPSEPATPLSGRATPSGPTLVKPSAIPATAPTPAPTSTTPRPTTATTAAAAAAAAAAPVPAVPSLASSTPVVKTPKDLLSEMDTVLGVEDRSSNYLARDLVSPMLAPAPESLRAADGYLRTQYGPGSWDPRLQYDARRREAARAEPIVIRAPTDQELRRQYGQDVPSAATPSAPPAAIYHRPPVPAAPQPRTVLDQYRARQPPIDTPSAPLPMDPRRMMEATSPYALRRPVEGSALQYLRDNQVGVVSTDTGRKYVHPDAVPYAPRHASPTAYYPAQYVPPDLRMEHKQSPGAGFEVPSPTSVGAVHEREEFLRHMRQMRRNLLATTGNVIS